MHEHFRYFEVGPDPFGRKWTAQFRWLQTAISIRHADTVDVKFLLKCDDGTEEEKVVALPHAALLEVCKEHNRKLTDPWCMKLAALHVRRMIETAEDIEKNLVTLTASEIADLDRELQGELEPNLLAKR
ncbi:MAG: hypothetical protein WAM39_29040 [Bryobacteraceae bacterium]